MDAEDTPTMPKKRRTAANKSSLNDVDTPVPSAEPKAEEQKPEEQDTVQPETKKLPTRRKGGSPKVVIAASSPAKEISLESEIQESIIHTPSPPRVAAGFVMDSIARHLHVSPTPAKPKQDAQTKGMKMEQVSEDTSDTLEGQETATPAEPKPTRIRFGSEEPAKTDAPTETAVPAPAPTPAAEEEDYESDSDEAPEEVTAASALTTAKAAEAEATRAFEAQQKKLELKRKERQDRIAEEQRQKRKREEKKAQKQAKLEARQQAKEPVKAPFKFDMNNLPSLLPSSILEAAGDKRPPTPPLIVSGPSAAELQKEKLARHIKFLERGEKPIKDVKKGKLNVHVLERQNKFIAPKVNSDSKNVREKWLKGRQNDRAFKKGKMVMGRTKVERRAVGGGFLRGDD
jgi:hypothetical protein